MSRILVSQPSFLTASMASAVLALSLLASPAAAQESVRTLTQEIDLGDHTLVHTRLRIGKLTVIGEDRDDITITSTILCARKDVEKCNEIAEDVSISASSNGDELTLGMEGITEAALRRMMVRNEVRVPRDTALEVDVTFGDATISGHTADLDVNVGTGDVEVRMDKRFVGTVELDAGGDVELRVGGQTIKGSGLLHESLDWSNDGGDASVELDVVLGDAVMIIE